MDFGLPLLLLHLAASNSPAPLSPFSGVKRDATCIIVEITSFLMTEIFSLKLINLHSIEVIRHTLFSLFISFIFYIFSIRNAFIIKSLKWYQISGLWSLFRLEKILISLKVDFRKLQNGWKIKSLRMIFNSVLEMFSLTCTLFSGLVRYCYKM